MSPGFFENPMGFSAGLGFILVYRNYVIWGLPCISQYLILGILNQMKNVLFSNRFICNLITKRKVILTSDTEGEHVLWDHQGGLHFSPHLLSKAAWDTERGSQLLIGCSGGRTQGFWQCILFLGAECGWSHLGSLSGIHFYLKPSSQNTHTCPNKLIQTHPTQLLMLSQSKATFLNRFVMRAKI